MDVCEVGGGGVPRRNRRMGGAHDECIVCQGPGVIFSQEFLLPKFLWLPSRSCRGLPTEKGKRGS